MLTTLARNRIALYRTSNELADPVTPSSTPMVVNVNVTPRYSGIVSVVVSPAPSSGGSISFTDGSTTEVIDVPSSGVAQGQESFSSFTSFTITGSELENKEISVTIKGADGGSIKCRRTLLECTPAQIRRGRGQYVAQREGTVQRETIVVMLPYMCSTTAIPREGDLIKDLDTLAEFIVTGAPLVQQVGISRFYELTAQRYQGG